MSEIQTELFAPPGEVGKDSISDEEAWLWAKQMLVEISEDLEESSQKKNEEHTKVAVEAFIEWRSLVKFISNVGIWMHRVENVKPAQLERHKTLVAGLIAVGGLIDSYVRHLPTASKDWVEMFINKTEMKCLKRSLDEAYEHWHVESPEGLLKQIEKALGS